MSAAPDIAAAAADQGREEGASVKPAMVRAWWVYAVPMAVAAVVRLWLLAVWFDSPFRWYHEVPGLDMRTHVREMADFLHGHRGFSLYYLIEAPGFLLGGSAGMVVTQAVLGILTAGLVALAALRVHGSRTAAMLAGLLAGLYAPAAMYELFHLKESVYLFAASLGLLLLVEARHRRFAPGWAFAAGAASTLPALVRFPGVLWLAAGLLWAFLVAAHQREAVLPEGNADSRRSVLARLRRGAWPVAGAASALALVALFNLALGHRQLPFGSGPGIAFYLRGEVAPKGPSPRAMPADASADVAAMAEAPGSPPPPSFFAAILRKSAETVQTTEIPNNLNFYFIRDNLRPLRWLIQPQWFLPAAFVGLLLLLVRRRGGFLVLTLLYAASFMIPMILFVPLARYRLALLPVLSLWAVFPWVALRPCAGRLRHAWMLFLWLALLVLAHHLLKSRDFQPGEVPLRVSDFLVYSDACRQDPRWMPEMVAALQVAGRMDARQVAPDALRCSLWLFERGEFAAARELLRPYLPPATADPRYPIAYATALLGCGETAAAAALLEAMPPCDDLDYCYQLGECRRIQGRHAAAAEAFRAGLRAARNDQQRNIFRQALARIPAEKHDDHER
jgi:hypothetical protein